MTDLSEKILKVFVDKQCVVLKDSDISLSLISQGIRCYTAEVRHHVQVFSPALFQLTINEDNSIIVHVEPKVKEPTGCSFL